MVLQWLVVPTMASTYSYYLPPGMTLASMQFQGTWLMPLSEAVLKLLPNVPQWVLDTIEKG